VIENVYFDILKLFYIKWSCIMKSLVLCVFAIIFALSFNLMADPILEIEGGTTYDWGNMKPESSPLTAKIKIWNKGDQLLEVKKVKPGCGCTTAPLDTNLIAPGKYATLDVTLNVASTNGPVTKSISIFSNDPKTDHTILFLKANIVRAVTVFPQFLSFSRLFVNTQEESKITLTNNTEKAIKIMDIQVTPPDMKVNLKKNDLLPVKEPFTLVGTYTPKEAGRFNCSVVITTDNQEMQNITINGWGNIVDQSKEVPASNGKDVTNPPNQLLNGSHK
jgi:hypothetical protein